MLAEFEKRLTLSGEKLWMAKWLNLKNAVHWHDETEIIYCQSGITEIVAEGEALQLTAGECVLLNGGTTHRIDTADGTVCITVLIANSLVSDAIGGFTLKSKKLKHSCNIPDYYSKIRAIMREKGDFYLTEANCLTTLLLTKIFKKEEKTAISVPEKNNRYALLKQMLNVIETEYAYITFEDICSRFGYSPAHFSRLFKGLTGISFTKYLISVKIHHAVKLLQSEKGLSITDVATACGFSSIRNFNRYFKLLTGYTPRELPSGFTLDYTAQKQHNTPTDPTLKSSIMLD